MFDNISKAIEIAEAVDEINDFHGTFTVYAAMSLESKKNIKQKIFFSGTEYFDLLLKTA